MKIAVIGTGSVGGTLGRAWAAKGHDVCFGVKAVADPRLQTVLQNAPGVRAIEIPGALLAGEVIVLDPIQVVGKHCAASGKVIAYEPDARVCSRCERVYHKAHVPETCACGQSLENLRPSEPVAKETGS